MKSTRHLLITALLFVLLSHSLCSAAKVEFKQHENKIDVLVDGKMFTSYLWKIDPTEPMYAKDCQLAKPVLFPVYSPSGEMMVRGYPFKNIEGESRDHPHHMGIYFTVDVNQDYFWGNSKADRPKIQHIKVTNMKSEKSSAVLTTVSHWIDGGGKAILEENRQMTFIASEKNQYEIDFDITLKALDKKVVITDTKEGMMAVRVAPWLRENDGTGEYLNSQGQKKEAGVWGRRAKWMRLQGTKDNTTRGILFFDHPQSTNYPTFWHARGYGCFTANPLGQGAFEKSRKVPNAENLNLTLLPGQQAAFKYRMVFYDGPITADQIEKQYKQYTLNGWSCVYAQDFENPDSIKDFRFTTPEKWQLTNSPDGGSALEFLGPGNYTPKVRSPLVIGMISDKMFGDFVLEADLLQTGKEYGHRDMCLFYNIQDPSHFYYTHIATKADPHAHNIFIVNDQPRTAIAQKTTEGIDWGKNLWHKVRIERTLADGSIKVFYDDMHEPIMLAEDKTFGTGYIGFGTFDDSGRIDNIKIYAPKETEKTPNFFSTK